MASCNGLEELSRDIIVMHFPINSSRVLQAFSACNAMFSISVTYAFYYFVEYNGSSDKQALVLFG